MSEESTGEATEKAVTPDADSLESTTVQTPVEQEVLTPSNDTADTAETVDMSDVLSVQEIDPNGERGGLSRKEYLRKQAEVSEPQDDRVAQLESEIAQLKETFSESRENADYLKETRKQLEQAKIEESFHGTLRDKGVDAATFNSQYKEAFKEEQQDLLDAGLSLAKATEKALKITLASYQADAKVKDTEQRAEGRAKATIPSSSTQATDKTVYTEAQVSKLSQAEYNRVMDLRDKGAVTITR